MPTDPYDERRERREIERMMRDLEDVVNTDGAPGDWRQILDHASSMASAASGIEITYAGEADERLLTAVVAHEWGHVLGLAHVESAEELMLPRGTARIGYGDGDLEGLARLGSIPCT